MYLPGVGALAGAIQRWMSDGVVRLLTMRSGPADSDLQGVAAGNPLEATALARLLFAGTSGSDDPTRAALPFLGAKGALESGHEAEVFLMGEAVYLMKTEVADACNPAAGRMSVRCCGKSPTTGSPYTSEEDAPLPVRWLRQTLKARTPSSRPRQSPRTTARTRTTSSRSERGCSAAARSDHRERPT